MYSFYKVRLPQNFIFVLEIMCGNVLLNVERVQVFFNFQDEVEPLQLNLTLEKILHRCNQIISKTEYTHVRKEVLRIESGKILNNISYFRLTRMSQT